MPALATGLAQPNQATPPLAPPSGDLTLPPSPPPSANQQQPTADPIAGVMARIAQGESGGDPNARYGFPSLPGAMGPAGVSHALGTYQDEPGTWVDTAKQWMAANPGQPPPNFRNPADQYKVNAFLARKTYGVDQNGRNLDEAAKAGSVDYSRLAHVWPSLGRGAAGFPDSSAVEKVRADKYTEAANLNEQAKAAIAQIGAMGGDLGKAMERIRAAQDKAEQAQEATLEAIKKPPQQPELDAVKHLSGLATVVGILGGLFTKSPMRASLNAAAAAMEAYNSGDQTAYKQSYDNWKTQTDMLFNIAKMQSENVRQVMLDEDLGLNERRALLDTTLRAAGLSSLADQARTQGDEAVVQWQDMQQKAQQAYQTHLDTLEQTASYREATLVNKEGVEWKTGTATGPGGQQVPVRYNAAQATFTDLTGNPLPFVPTNFTPGGGSSGAAPKFGSLDDLMQRWRQDFVAKNGREPTTGEIAAQHAELTNESKPQGRLAQQQNQRLMIGANEVAKAVTNMTKLPPGTTLGMFGGAQAAMGEDPAENARKILLNEVTPQASQVLKALTNGVSRGLGILEAAGSAQGLVGLSKQLQSDLPEANDTGLTIAAKYADVRQIVEAATEVLQTNPDITKEQKALLTEITKQVQRAVPFTAGDVAEALGGSDESFARFARKLGLGKGGDHPAVQQNGWMYEWRNGGYEPVSPVQ